MDWGWRSGFIFLKVEGEYSDAPQGAMKPFKAHVGNNNLYRVVELELAAPLIVAAGAPASVALTADAARLLRDVVTNGEDNIIGGPDGSPASVVADNYAAWLSVATP